MSSQFKICNGFTWNEFAEVLLNGFSSKISIEKHSQAIYLMGYLDQIDALAMLVEKDYTDGDYLDDFAAYYVRCHENYHRRCKRIHFFSRSIEEIQFLKIISGNAEDREKEEFCDSYLGFIVVRPLPRAIIGRTVLKTYPDDDGRRNYTCVKDYDVNLFGIDLSIKGSLAFQEQDTVIAACATVSLWCCFHKTAELFGTPAPRPAAITRVANQVVTHSRTFPSNGLIVQQMCDAIRQVGLEPEVFNIKELDKFPLVDLIYGYLNMGLPVILGATVKTEANVEIGFHAVTLSGFSLRDEQFSTKEDVTPIHTIGSRIDEFYAHDDQNGPFSRLGREARDNTLIAEYPTTIECISSEGKKEKRILYPRVIVIPIYNKIRVTYTGIQIWISCLSDIIKKFLESQINTEELEWSTYLIEANKLKSCIKEENILEKAKINFLVRHHPRFIWRSTLSFHKKGADSTYQDIKVIDFFADATDIPHGFPLYQVLWYQEEFRSSLKEGLDKTSENLSAFLKEIKEKDSDKYSRLILFLKENISEEKTMSSQNYFNQEAFINESIRILSMMEARELDDEDNLENLVFSSSQFPDSDKLESSKKAKEIVARTDIKQLICPALQSGAYDAVEMTKKIGPILIGASLAGTIAIPLNPMIFAMISLIIVRMGIEGFCQNSK
jgi:hypothetical protein